jgi:hypothetical protein
MPTRGRPEKLLRAIRSLTDRMSESPTQQVEILLRIDDDDLPTLRALECHQAPCPLYAYSGPRGGGYFDLHQHINMMARRAKGDWLMNFNDDAEMLTQNWDLMFRDNITFDEGGVFFGVPDGIYLLMPDGWQKCEFFCVRREVFRVLGRLSAYTGVDDWLWTIFSFIGRYRHCKLQVRHQNDEDRTFREGSRVSREANWYGMDLVREKLKDITKIVDYIDGFKQ